jgi:menaquinone-specific isochorismate synthase
VVRTVPVADPGDLIVQLPGPGSLAWIRQGEGLAGWGEVARVTVPAGQDRFTTADKWLRALLDGALIEDRVGAPGCGPVAFGSFTFDPTSEGSVLILPQVVLGRRGGQAWLTTITGQPPAPADPVPLAGPGLAGPGLADPGLADPWLARYGLDQAGLCQARLADTPVPGPPAADPIRWHDGSLTALQWERAVATAVDRIKAGRLQKVVLARDLYASASGLIDERLLLGRLAERYPDCYTFACGGLVGATPELLIRRQGLQISSLVLAGTAPRGDDPARDAALGTALLASAKDTEEHGYAAAGVRESLAPLCDELTVAPRPALLRLANVQHLATTISGRLAVGADGTSPSVLALADALHPTAAVCGTPAETAMELIRELEGMDRGRYAGPVGWVDSAGNGEWGIALRCAELDGIRARLFAGGGIVADSDPAAELAETQAKLRPMRSALEG